MNPTPTLRALLVLPLLAAAPLSAQGLDRLYGLDRGTVGAPPKIHTVNTANLNCAIQRSCDLPAPMDVHAVSLGGATFDSSQGLLWVSDGRDLVLSHTTCGVVCSYAIPTTMAGITGLGFNRARGWIYSSHTDNAIRIWRSSSTCGLALLGSCTVGNLIAGEIVAGIEFDGRGHPGYPNGRLFCVTTRGYLIVLHEPAPGTCAEICRVTLPTCSTGRFLTWQGLTYDPATRTIYVTDGKQLMALQESNQGCTLNLLGCCAACPFPNCYDYSGLAWSSGGIGVAPGSQPCTDVICGCVPQVGAEGFPSVLNPGFRLTLSGLNPNGVSIFLLTLGPPLPSPVPVACGRFYGNPTPMLLTFAASHSSATGCGSRAVLPMGFFDASTVGLGFTCQSATLCPASAGVGVALSAALSMQIGW